MREKRPLAFGGVFVLGSGFCLVFLFGFGVACVLFPSSCCASFPFNDDLGTPPTRRPHSWKKNLKQGPDVRRRAQFPKTFAFNKILCVDFLLIQFKEQRVPILNMICAGTSCQVAVRAPMSTTRGGTPAWKLFVES